MRIAVDASCWSNRRGFGRYTRELLAELVPLLAQRGHTPLLVVDRQTAPEVRAALPDFEVAEAATRAQPTRAAAADGARSPADLWRMSRTLAKAQCDVVFFPAVYSFFPVPRGLPAVVTFHDAIAEQFPEMIFPDRRSRWFWALKVRWALAQASAVLTVSQSARSQLADAFGLRQESITVSGEGPPSDLSVPDDATLQEVATRFGLDRTPRILYVGGLSPHKNLDGLLRALTRLEGEPWHLMLVGDIESEAFHSCYRDLVNLVGELHLESRVTFTGYVSAQDLAALYGLADLLVLPSWSEGFGLPAVEAMSCGVPVAASRAGSLPEVVGDAGVFFDPADTDEMADALGRLLRDADLRRRLGRRGFDAVHRHSWEDAAHRVALLLEDVAGGSG